MVDAPRPHPLETLRWVVPARKLEGAIRELTDSSILVVVPEAEEVGRQLGFEIRDSAKVVGVGVGRVIARDASGLRLQLITLGIDRHLVRRLNGEKALPPPMPVLPRTTSGGPAYGPQSPSPAARRPPSRPPAAEAAKAADASAHVEQLEVRAEGIIIGIDLGTTNTVAAALVDGKPQILPSRTGTTATPSMITFDPNGRYHVGQRAVDRQILYPERTVHGSKRLVGRTYRADIAREFQTHFAYPLGEADGQRFGVRLEDRVISMDTIAARILDEVRSCAEAHLEQPVGAAVITVPAYFSEVQREAVRRAAAEANLVVHRIVNEPTAAAMAYGQKRPDQSRIAVWDFGGGTFDCSIVEVQDDELVVLATGGDNFLGGADFDDLVASHLLAEFQKMNGVTFEPTLQQIARLREAAETAKKTLSSEDEANLLIHEFITEPSRLHLALVLQRETFDAVTRELVDHTVEIARGVVERAGLTADAIDDVVLVGGSTRIPAVQAAVESFFGRRPSKRINADEAVAVGAAYLADDLGKGLTLRDILPMSVGRGVPGPGYEPIVRRYSRLPLEQELVVPSDFLGSVSIPLFQGDSERLSDNEYLCTLTVEDRSLWEEDAKVRIVIAFDEHCVMTVEAFHAQTGQPLPLTLDRGRHLPEVLRDLGVPTEKDGSLPPPPMRRGGVFQRLGRLFR